VLVFCFLIEIGYPNYKFYFTIWALGRYAKAWGNEAIGGGEVTEQSATWTVPSVVV
jgi:hypothetical protein